MTYFLTGLGIHCHDWNQRHLSHPDVHHGVLFQLRCFCTGGKELAVVKLLRPAVDQTVGVMQGVRHVEPLEFGTLNLGTRRVEKVVVVLLSNDDSVGTFETPTNQIPSI